MKTNKKIGLISIVSLIFLLLFSGQTPSVHAGVTTDGGVKGGVLLHGIFMPQQLAWYPNATDMHMRLYTKRETLNIMGWEVTISDFTVATSARDGPRAVDIDASGANIPYREGVIIDVKVWLNRNAKFCPNAKGSLVQWTLGAQAINAQPRHIWRWGWPKPHPKNPGQFLHEFCITNDDPTDYLNVTGLAFNATMDWYEDLTQIIFPSPHPNFTLAPGQSWCTNITTLGPLYGGHIYFNYNITGSDILSENWEDHPITEPPEDVGGIGVPVDKFGLLAPYIGLASTILVATAATAIYVKRRKKKQ